MTQEAPHRDINEGDYLVRLQPEDKVVRASASEVYLENTSMSEVEPGNRRVIFIDKTKQICSLDNYCRSGTRAEWPCEQLIVKRSKVGNGPYRNTDLPDSTVREPGIWVFGSVVIAENDSLTLCPHDRVVQIQQTYDFNKDDFSFSDLNPSIGLDGIKFSPELVNKINITFIYCERCNCIIDHLEPVLNSESS
jgi:hypothetical protein